MDFQELADEAFRDLLRKHGRPTELISALRQSAGEGPPSAPRRGIRMQGTGASRPAKAKR